MDLGGRIVVTNDDGIDAPGLATLAAVAAQFGEIIVAAPASVQSGVGHQVTTDLPIEVIPLAPGRYRIDGTPADCARLAHAALAPGAAWLLSGINHGANLGADVYTSGTVAAAREAALLGVPSVAVSQYVAPGRRVDWALTARRLAPLLRELLAQRLPPGHFWNINLPHPPDDAADPLVVYCGLDTRPHGIRYRRDGDEFVYTGDYHARPRQAGRDVDVCMGGAIAVTRVTLEIAAG
jgi:5'-nucleotidase